MLTTQRKKLLLARLAAEGQLVAKALAQELGTSEDTIRRDLRELAAEGRLQRVHGGALPASAAMGDLPAREQVSTADKLALGRFGASLIQPGPGRDPRRRHHGDPGGAPSRAGPARDHRHAQPHGGRRARAASRASRS